MGNNSAYWKNRRELDAARREAHKAFDRLWIKSSANRGRPLMDRSVAYAQLAQYLGIDYLDCHFSLFDIDKCNRAREFALMHTGAAQ